MPNKVLDSDSLIFNDNNSSKVLHNSLPLYLKNLFKYSCTTTSDIFLIIFCYMILNLNKSTHFISIVGMMYSNYTIFFGFSFDFFEPVNTLCLPYLAKNNIRLYALKVWKIGILNILFYSFGLLIFAIVKYLIFYYQTNLLDQFLISLNFGYEFALLPGLAFMINNFLRGMVEFRFY